MEHNKIEFRVLINYPNSNFKPGDILVESDLIPDMSVGKFIDETTGWAWITNPFDFPEILQPLYDKCTKGSIWSKAYGITA